MPNYRIGIVGAGAIGCYYGGRLAERGRDVHFLMRSDYEHVKKRGLKVKSKQGNFHLQGVNAYRSSEEIGPCDVVFVSLKATANEHREALIAPLLKKDTAIVILENGLGGDEELAALFGPERVVGGLCFVCLNRTAPGVIEHSAQGQISLGEFTKYPLPRTHEIAWELKRCGVPCTVVEDLQRERWKKLVWNIPFNGLSIAAGGIDTQQILSDPSLETLVRKLMYEVIDAARALGHDLPVTLVDDMVSRTKAMGGYKPSSLIDFLAGREVEVEAIWGEPYRRASNAGAQTGRMEALYYLIRHATTHKTFP
ncbi:2-dehydropantoate 2-reductase [Verrucomicrobiales bacterium]|nr:2-dehydropantoate 2-reductase [Verrucomicrobiales bacterium]